MRLRLVLSLGLAAASLSATAASAATLTAAEILKDFNGVVYGNATTTSDVEGAIVVGGNFSSATDYLNPKGVTLPAGYGAVTVFGTLTGGSNNINNSGDAYIADTSNGIHPNYNGGHALATAPSETISDFETTLNTFSTSLSTLANTSTLPPTDNNEVITATPGVNGIAVFNITASELDAISSFKIDLNGATSVIFNVDASNANPSLNGIVNFTANDESGVTGADQIIWNFYNAKSVTIGDELAGTVLAPLASLQSGVIDGAMVAKSWTTQNELHNYGFTGTLPPSSPPTSPAPEPGTWALLLAGFGGLGAMLRRRVGAMRTA